MEGLVLPCTILTYVEFRTNPEPYLVRGVVHGGIRSV